MPAASSVFVASFPPKLHAEPGQFSTFRHPQAAADARLASVTVKKLNATNLKIAHLA